MENGERGFVVFIVIVFVVVALAVVVLVIIVLAEVVLGGQRMKLWLIVENF